MESFAGITNTKTYEVKDPLTIEVNGEETDTFVNEVEKGSILITKTGLEGTDQPSFHSTLTMTLLAMALMMS